MADRITVGNVEVMAFVDLVPPAYAPPLFFPDIPLEDWEPYRAEFLDNGKIQLYFGCFVIRSGDQLILVDSGMGPGPHPTQGNGGGQLLDLLSTTGNQPWRYYYSRFTPTCTATMSVGTFRKATAGLSPRSPTPATWCPNWTGITSTLLQ